MNKTCLVVNVETALPLVGTRFSILSADATRRHARAAVYAQLEGGRVAVVTAGHMRVDLECSGDFDGRPLTLLARINPGDKSTLMPDDPIVICTRDTSDAETTREPTSERVVSDVGIFEVIPKEDDAISNLCEMQLSGTYHRGIPCVDYNESAKVHVKSPLGDDGTTPRFIGTISALVCRRLGRQYIHIYFEADLTHGLPPELGDSGMPFFDSEGRMHSFLIAYSIAPTGAIKLILEPANVALAQIRKRLGDTRLSFAKIRTPGDPVFPVVSIGAAIFGFVVLVGVELGLFARRHNSAQGSTRTVIVAGDARPIQHAASPRDSDSQRQSLLLHKRK